MRDTRKTLLISGGLALCGTAMVAAGAVLMETEGESILSAGLLIVGFAIAPIAAFLFIGYCVSGLRKEALEQG